MKTTETTAIEPGNRIHLPEEWAKDLGLRDEVVLVKTGGGILVLPRPTATWDDIFSTRLTARPCDVGRAHEVTEVTGDDLLF